MYYLGTQHAGPDVEMFLVGNKSDAEALRTVTEAEGVRVSIPDSHLMFEALF